jgi:hypothetical protein
MSGLLALHIFAGSLALVSAGAALLVKKAVNLIGGLGAPSFFQW